MFITKLLQNLFTRCIMIKWSNSNVFQRSKIKNKKQIIGQNEDKKEQSDDCKIVVKEWG